MSDTERICICSQQEHFHEEDDTVQTKQVPDRRDIMYIPNDGSE